MGAQKSMNPNAFLWSLRCNALLSLLVRAVEFLTPSERRQVSGGVSKLRREWMQVVVGTGILDSLADKCYKPDAIFSPLLRHGYVPVLNRFSRDPQLLFGSTEAPQA